LRASALAGTADCESAAVSDWEVDSGAGCPTNRISKPSPAPSIPANFLRSSTFSTRVQVSDIIANASEPYKTIFAVAWFTGLRAGEILALTVDDLSFDKRTIRVWKSADDNTREIRNQTKGKKAATLPMPTELETMLRDYLMRYEPSPDGLLFPAPRRKGFPRSRDNVVRHGLKPILKKLGIPRHNAGLHAFRHGLATELAEQSVPLTTMQAQMRHADITTTLRVYTHVIPQTHRDAMENLGIGQSLRGIITLRKTQAK
jgi:integrase